MKTATAVKQLAQLVKRDLDREFYREGLRYDMEPSSRQQEIWDTVMDQVRHDLEEAMHVLYLSPEEPK